MVPDPSESETDPAFAIAALINGMLEVPLRCPFHDEHITMCDDFRNFSHRFCTTEAEVPTAAERYSYNIDTAAKSSE